MTSDTQSLGMNTSRSKLHCHTPVAIYSITKAGRDTAGNTPITMTKKIEIERNEASCRAYTGLFDDRAVPLRPPERNGEPPR